MKKKTGTYITGLVVVLFFVMILVSAGTYAYWQWSSDSEKNKNVVFNTSGDISKYIIYDEGDSYFVGDFQPESAFCQTVNTTVSFYKNSDIEHVKIMASIHMDINSIGDGIAGSDSVYWIITEGDDTIDCVNGLDSDSVINYGTFNGTVAGESKTLISNIEVETSIKQFTVWIWIDSNGDNLSLLSGETIDTNIWTQFDQVGNGENGYSIPLLDEGMIPVKLSSNGTVTTVLPSELGWYNYDNKEWANVVLVNDDSRSTYKNTTGVIVEQSDILAYYVWIPRYKYQIWTTDVSTTGDEQTIEIKFEPEDEPMSLGTEVGEWRTHPAFWWDDNSDGNVDLGETVAGIWVGKFETSANTDSKCYTYGSPDNCSSANVSPRILPNVQSLRWQNISNQFATSQKFSSSGNVYGLSSTITDAHVMKNSEWGAVAYLAHSVYGINQEVYINNSEIFYTGRSGGNVSGSVLPLYQQYSGLTSDVIRHNAYGYYTWIGQTLSLSGILGDYASNRNLGTYASTTGNVTGIYDMSGGSYEYVMGNYNGKITNTGFSSMVASKYYDEYTTDNQATACGGNVCYGHALSETFNWYNDGTAFVNNTALWLIRGGHSYDSANAGVFYTGSYNGSASGYAWRSVLIVNYKSNVSEGGGTTTCDSGKYLSNGSCLTCPANNYCTGGTTQPVACPEDKPLAPAGSSSSAACYYSPGTSAGGSGSSDDDDDGGSDACTDLTDKSCCQSRCPSGLFADVSSGSCRCCIKGSSECTIIVQ